MHIMLKERLQHAKLLDNGTIVNVAKQWHINSLQVPLLRSNDVVAAGIGIKERLLEINQYIHMRYINMQKLVCFARTKEQTILQSVWFVWNCVYMRLLYILQHL